MDFEKNSRITEYLRRYGWSSESLGRQVWVSGWEGETEGFDLRIIEKSHLVIFEAHPRAKFDPKIVDYADLLGFLNEVNGQASGAWAFVTDCHSLMIRTSLLKSPMNFSSFESALGICAFYAESISQQFRTFVANNPARLECNL